MVKKLFSLTILACSVVGLMAQPAGGKKISNELIGIFFEDISSSADGGICAELVQNGSFEYNVSERDGWGPGTAWKAIRPGHSLGYLEARQIDPLNENNPNYLKNKNCHFHYSLYFDLILYFFLLIFFYVLFL